MEELLNKLIEKGWKPYGNELYSGAKMNSSTQVGLLIKKDTGYMNIPYTLREIVSKESGLWQFVCENGMVKEEHKHERILDPTFGEGWEDCKRQEHDGNYGYRLIESALCDEDKLEDFILDNVKIEGTK